MEINTHMKIIDFKEKILKNETPVAYIDEDKKNLFKFYAGQQGIFIPDNSLFNFFSSEFMDKEGLASIRVVEKLLIKNEILNLGKQLDYVMLSTFSIIHEEGHYYHYMQEYYEQGKSIEEYLNEYRRQYKLFEIDFYKKDRSIKSIEDCIERQELYRKIDFEKIADNYAIEQIKNDEYILSLFKN